MGDGFLRLVFAQQDPVPAPSILLWYIECLEFYGPMLFVAGLATFVGACFAVARRRTAGDVAMAAVFLPIPLLIGMVGTIDGLIDSFSVLATADHGVSWGEVAEGYLSALIIAKCSVIATLPTVLLLFCFWFVRVARVQVE